MTARQDKFHVFCALLLALCLQSLRSAHATPSFEFATVEQGRVIVTQRDEYIQRLSPLERALKTKSEAPVNEPEFLQRLAATIQPWPDAQRTVVLAALDSIRSRLSELNLPLPATVLFVRFSGDVEGGAPHTRGNAVLLTDRSIERADLLPHLIAHELFHIASRQNRALRNALYATIGFVPIEEVALEARLASMKITNPDAPLIDVAVQVRSSSGPVWVTPLLQATVDRYDARQGGDFFKFMKLNWMEVSRGEVVPAGAQVPPQLYETSALTGLVEQIGRNTGYIIHPEEILAENFAQVATGKTGVSPEVHQRLIDAMSRHAGISR